MSKSEFYHRVADTAREATVFLSLAFIGIPGWIVVNQVYIWLRHGFWPSQPLYAFLMEHRLYPWTDWQGVQRILDWLLTMPLALAVALAVLVVIGVVTWIGEKARDKGDEIDRLEKTSPSP